MVSIEVSDPAPIDMHRDRVAIARSIGTGSKSSDALVRAAGFPADEHDVSEGILIERLAGDLEPVGMIAGEEGDALGRYCPQGRRTTTAGPSCVLRIAACRSRSGAADDPPARRH